MNIIDIIKKWRVMWSPFQARVSSDSASLALLFFQKLAVYEVCWKFCTAGQVTDGLWGIVFHLKQCLHKRATLLSNTLIACLVIIHECHIYAVQIFKILIMYFSYRIVI
jgi:hypothetical protein